MSNLWRGVWNPFSTTGRELRREARERRRIADELHEHSISMKNHHESIFQEQKALADELRLERRRNHFSDMFQSVPPRHP